MITMILSLLVISFALAAHGSENLCEPVNSLKADPENSHNYYECSSYGWQKMPCASDLVFNEKLSICDDSDEAASDQDDQSENEAVDTDQILCEPVSSLKADPENTHNYYECSSYGWQKMPCASNVVFNEKLSKCDDSASDQDDQSANNSDSDSDSDESDEDDQSESNDSDSDLESCSTTGQLKADTKHCDLYYQCTSCGWSLVSCQTGLLFNPKTSVCDKAEKVTCAKDTDLEPCETLGQFKANTKHCDTYYKCTKCGWALVTCGSGLFFNSKTATCDGSEGVTCANDDNGDSKLKLCETVGQLKADSETCDHYYRCTKNGWSLSPCASGLLFNSKALACESADQVTCGTDANDDDQSEDDEQDDETDKLEPCDVLSALKSDPKDCKKYYQCTSYGWQHMPCYTGLVFNPNKSQCDYTYNYECSVETN